jgi:hypothetical protein
VFVSASSVAKLTSDREPAKRKPLRLLLNVGYMGTTIGRIDSYTPARLGEASEAC